jgi:phosphoenolpyruvate-protein kinase (PTS system EI component)
MVIINETSKNITNNQHKEEEQQQQTDELKKKIKRPQDERDELALIAYVAGNMGTVYEMEPVNEFLSAGALEV